MTLQRKAISMKSLKKNQKKKKTMRVRDSSEHKSLNCISACIVLQPFNAWHPGHPSFHLEIRWWSHFNSNLFSPADFVSFLFVFLIISLNTLIHQRRIIEIQGTGVYVILKHTFNHTARKHYFVGLVHVGSPSASLEIIKSFRWS